MPLLQVVAAYWAAVGLPEISRALVLNPNNGVIQLSVIELPGFRRRRAHKSCLSYEVISKDISRLALNLQRRQNREPGHRLP